MEPPRKTPSHPRATQPESKRTRGVRRCDQNKMSASLTLRVESGPFPSCLVRFPQAYEITESKFDYEYRAWSKKLFLVLITGRTSSTFDGIVCGKYLQTIGSAPGYHRIQYSLGSIRSSKLTTQVSLDLPRINLEHV
ncbi:unnamed protein product [Nesidiocoris tenuis]|uniref:Uncharacterized protein n=1 Tax=Nesidiocoris tenuis TaxID=355587 RepID=A0A6H5HL04_9HEMI|nr:unnamed protein product [Nesidiocoris tenuis]